MLNILLNNISFMFCDQSFLRASCIVFFVGASCPLIGSFLVQKHMALLGDAIGHIALTGIALGWIVGSIANLVPKDILAIPFALIVAVLSSLLIEFLRDKAGASGDLAIAIMLYGGVAGGVILIKIAGGSSANLIGYLFGSLSTVSNTDVIVAIICSLIVIIPCVIGKQYLFAGIYDSEYAKSKKISTKTVNTILAVTSALSVTAAGKVVGLLLVSALMIIPVATSSLFSKSFSGTMINSAIIGILVSFVGLVITYWVDLAPGATIVILSIASYAIVLLTKTLIRR